MMQNTSNPECERSAELHVRVVLGELLSRTERANLDAHLAACVECQKTCAELGSTHAMLGAAFAHPPVVVPLPQTQSSKVSELKVFSAAAPRSSYWKPAAVAALVLLGALGVFVGNRVMRQPGATNGIAVIKKGALKSAAGKDVAILSPKERYTATEPTVLVMGQAMVKVQTGTVFELSGPSASNTQVNLKNGDVYATKRENQAPFRVSCDAFDADVHSGDAFVSEEGTTVRHGVVIVFNGMAEIRSGNNDAVPLTAGQVFYSVGGQSQTAALAEVSPDKEQGADDPTALRKVYQLRVEGYQQELKRLKEKLAVLPADSEQRRELQARLELVTSYHEQHQRRLQALNGDLRSIPSIPFDQIDRGRKGRSDPLTWL